MHDQAGVNPSTDKIDHFLWKEKKSTFYLYESLATVSEGYLLKFFPNDQIITKTTAW